MIGKWNPQKTFGDAGRTTATWDPSISAPKGAGTQIGGLHGGLLGGSVGGSIGGPIGYKVGSDIGSQYGKKVGSGVPGMSGQQPGPEAPMTPDQRPELSPWEAMNQAEIRSTDLFKPTMFNAEAMQTGLAAMSPWQAMALEKQSAEQAKAMDEAARSQAGAVAGARTSLAMRGGLRGGAAERLARSGAENLAQTMQQQRQVGAIQRGEIGLRGAEMAKDIAQGNVAAQTEGQARNIQAALAELAAKRGYNIREFEEKAKMYGAEKTGQAIGREPKPTLFGDPFGYLKSQF